MKKWTNEEIDKRLSVIISDLKHQTANRQEVTDKNIKRDLYMSVIRELYSERGFLLHEKETDGTDRMGCFVKGYVREVWEYLDEAYDLIHDRTYVKDSFNSLIDRLRDASNMKYPDRQWKSGFRENVELAWRGKEEQLRLQVEKLESELNI